jgi:hypothetical protein
VPAHHNAEKYVDAYLEAAGIAGEKKTPLLRSLDTHRRLTGQPMHHNDSLRMIQRRAADAGQSKETCCHTFRATGIAAYLEDGGTIEHAQAITNHGSPKTTKLYDRTRDQSTLDDIEKIQTRVRFLLATALSGQDNSIGNQQLRPTAHIRPASSFLWMENRFGEHRKCPPNRFGCRALLRRGARDAPGGLSHGRLAYPHSAADCPDSPGHFGFFPDPWRGVAPCTPSPVVRGASLVPV